jgi:hypothetical protein
LQAAAEDIEKFRRQTPHRTVIWDGQIANVCCSTTAIRFDVVNTSCSGLRQKHCAHESHRLLAEKTPCDSIERHFSAGLAAAKSTWAFSPCDMLPVSPYPTPPARSDRYAPSRESREGLPA